MPAFFKSIDTILWGRKTYAKGLEMGGIEKGMKAVGFGPEIKNYVFSRHPRESTEPTVKFVNEPIKAFAQRLRTQPGKHIWMMGGGEIIASFLDQGEIDEFRINVIPILIGEGIPLIQPRHRSIRLKLLSTKAFPDGVVHLHYRKFVRTIRPAGGSLTFPVSFRVKLMRGRRLDALNRWYAPL